MKVYRAEGVPDRWVVDGRVYGVMFGLKFRMLGYKMLIIMKF